mgnify:FL=1
MKIIKFKSKQKYRYKRKIIIKDLILKIFVGIHDFEKIKKQRVKFNIEITSDPNLVPERKNLNTIINYEKVINDIKKLTDNKHHELLENLADNLFVQIFKNNNVKKINLKIEKLDIIKEAASVGIEVSKIKS